MGYMMWVCVPDIDAPLLGGGRVVACLRASAGVGRGLAPGLTRALSGLRAVGWGGMSFSSIGRLPRHPVAAVAAVMWLAGWLLVIGAHSTLISSHTAVPHAAHVLPATLGGEFTLNVDHPHADKGPSSAHPERLVAAVLPRSAPASAVLVWLGVVGAVALIGWRPELAAPAGRGPPRRRVAYFTGQDRLTRFCLSRR